MATSPFPPLPFVWVCPPGTTLSGPGESLSGSTAPLCFDIFGNSIAAFLQFTEQVPSQVGQEQTTVSPGLGAAVAVAQATAINNAVNQFNLQNNIDTGPIGTAIQGGLQQVVNEVANAQNQAAATVASTVSNLSSSLFDWVRNIGEWLVQHISTVIDAIGSHLKDIVGTIIDTVGKAVENAVSALASTIGPIIEHIATAVRDAVAFYQQTIQPILTGVADAVKIVSAAVTAIEKDLNAGLQGILQLPTDIANAFSGLESIFQRTVNALKAKDLDVWSTIGGYDSTHQMTGDFKALHQAITGLSATVKGAVPKFSGVELTEPSLANNLPQIIESINSIMVALIQGLWKILHDPLLSTELLGGLAGSIFTEVLEPVEVLAFLWEVMKTPLEVVGELAGELVREKVPLTKLDASTVVSAYQRGILDARALNEELKVQGWSADRQRVMQELAEYFPTIEETFDKWHRGIIEQGDLNQLLKEHGMTPEEIQAQTEQSFHIPSVGLFTQAFQYGELTVDDVNAVLKDNRYTDAERVALLATIFRPANQSEVHAAILREALMGAFGFDPSQFNTTPPYWLNAARHSGLSEDTANILWKGTWNFLDIGTWIELFKRGFVSPVQVKDILSAAHIPTELHSSLVDSTRPLIPFRTIPGMVAAGVLSESEALHKLQQHGYTLDDAVLLLKYATRASKSTKATTATTQHATSIAQAKTFFEDGAIDEQQYTAVLKEHGLDQPTIDLDIALAKTEAQAKERKQIGTDIINEFQAGLIDEAAAMQQLSQSGLTIAEQAKVARSLRSATAGKTKLPSEAELRAFAVHEIISVDDYFNGLVTIGFSPQWAGAFRDLHFPVGPAASAVTP